MIDLTLTAEKPDEDHALLQKIDEVLALGGVVALPTDTIYGLSCLPDKAAALERISEMKGREKNKTFLLLVNDWQMVEQWAQLLPEHRAALEKVWPGNTTVILPAKQNLPYLTSADNTVALRWPAYPFLNKLMSKIGSALVSTSLNKAGQPPLVEPAGLEDYFGAAAPELVVQAGPLEAQPSQIIDLRNPGEPRVIR